MNNTASIIHNANCSDCGWPIVHVCCNHPFTDFKDSKNWDYWIYCSNKSCSHHEGEGVLEIDQDWVKWSDRKEIDFPDLIKKYMDFVLDCEGVHFLEYSNLQGALDMGFTEEGWNFLQKTASELVKTQNKKFNSKQ